MDERFVGLLPDTVAVRTMSSDAPLSQLTREERDFIRSAVPSRQGEFAAARVCARGALRDLGIGTTDPVSLVPGPQRDISWPAGFLGSITHCDGLRAAAVVSAEHGPGERVVGLGIDAEVNEALPADVIDLVSVPAERPMLRRLADTDHSVAWDRVLFSAKESVFKTWFPLTRTWLDFTECSLTIEDSGAFHGEFLVPGPTVAGTVVTGVDGRWRVSGGHVLTAVCLIVRSG